MQGKDDTIFSTTDKIEGFKGKLKLWLVYLEKGSTEIFPNLCSLGENVTFIPLIVEHLDTFTRSSVNISRPMMKNEIGFVIPST
jgi:hypothetical protein